MLDETIHLLELFFRVVFQQMIIVFAQRDHLAHVVNQHRRLKLAVGFFTQVEDRQAGGQILVIRRIAGDKIRRGFDNGFVDVGRFDAVVELNVGAQFNLRDRYVIQPFCRPIQHPVDFIQIDAFSTTITLRHQQTLIHVSVLKKKVSPAYPQF